MLLKANPFGLYGQSLRDSLNNLSHYRRVMNIR